MNTDRFIVANMKCNGCANIIKTELSRVDGISEIYIDLTKSEVIVNYASEKLTTNDIAKTLGNIGYPVVS
ncbi:MAG TPA: hypothetical protein DIW31_06295 [Bacteroidales bacterium]|nr:hypothetical protein [Bacteroidales bacterium]